MWKLNVPNAEKVFLLRPCQEALPTNLDLLKKIVESPNCPICLEEEASVAHALGGCIAVQDAWSYCSMKIKKSYFPKKGFMELIKAMCDVLEKDHQMSLQ